MIGTQMELDLTTRSFQQPSWSNPATSVEGLTTFDQARKQLGLNWDLKRRQRKTKGAERWYDIIRSDTNEVVYPAATETFKLVNLSDFGRFVEASLLGSNVKWDTFHVFDRGAAMFSTVRLDEPIVIPGDKSPIYPFMGFANRVDGKGSLRSFLAMERAWCANMLNTMVMRAGKSGGLVKFTHSSKFKMDRAIKATKAMIDAERQMANEFVNEAGRLNQIVMDHESFIKQWLPHSEDMTDKQHRNVDTKRASFYQALNGPFKPERTDTAWALLQAAVQSYQYEFPTSGNQAREKRAVGMMAPSMYKHKELKKAYLIVNDHR